MIYLKKRYITIYQYYIFCSNFDISWYIISFDISIYLWKYRCFFENILRYIANMIYHDISFHDISRYIARYNQIYWYIAIYLQNIAIFPNTFWKIEESDFEEKQNEKVSSSFCKFFRSSNSIKILDGFISQQYERLISDQNIMLTLIVNSLQTQAS